MGFGFHQLAHHIDELADIFQVDLGNDLDQLAVLFCDAGQLDRFDIELLAPDQVQQQIQRAVVARQIDVEDNHLTGDPG